MLTERELLALNCYEEAANEIPEGRAAIARVVLNRMHLKFFSDGTIPGTILTYAQFSWVHFGMMDGKYKRVIGKTDAEVEKRVMGLQKIPLQTRLAECDAVAQQVFAGTFHGPLYNQLTDDTVLYLNPRILPKLPAWALKDKFVTTIGHHDFYRA